MKKLEFRFTVFFFCLILFSGVSAQNAPINDLIKREADLLELVKLDKTIKLDIRYARSDNFVGRPVYAEARAFLQRPAAEAVLKVHKELKKQGLGLAIFDGYRPWTITKLFWEVTPEDKRKFVANPKSGSRHNRGCAVDLSIYNLKTGKLVPMPSDFDEFTERASPNYKGGTAEETKNRELLRRLMEANGFTVNENEWWHFDYKDWKSYGLYDISFPALAGQKDLPAKPKIKEDKRLKKFFDEAGIKGGIYIYDLKNSSYLIYDRKRMDTEFIPASTSKIIHSLVFLDSGALKDENEIIKWDGKPKAFKTWEQDLDLRTAYKVSAVWFYHELSRKISREMMQQYYDKSDYGNRNTNGYGEPYWVKGDVRITPRQQLEFLVRLYQNRLPFSPQVIDKVKDIMIEEKTEKYTLRSKTGWADAYIPQVGWWIGYVEKEENVYFFATELDMKDGDDAAKRKVITRNVLRELKILE